MKSLSQIEPRTPISSLPFIISGSGSYYLAGYLTGTSGQSGITVQADNVTLDLNGFALIGTGGSLNGIAAAAGTQGLVVYNGIVRGWGGNGLDAGAAFHCRMERVLTSNNGGNGLSAGSDTFITDCLSLANGGEGIRVVSSCIVLNSSSQTNGTSGIHALGTGNRIEGDNVIGNQGTGIVVDATANLVIKNNAAYNVATDYTIAPGNSYGQLVQTPGPGFTNASAWANFSSSCATGQTFCAGVCVSLSTSANNCGVCGNICNTQNGTPGCVGGNCVVAGCNTGYADCDANPANGCETATTSDINNCGGCGIVCGMALNGTAGCGGGHCQVVSCNPGYADCDAAFANGCETHTATDLNNCGFCGHACGTPANGTAGCSSGNCFVVACNPGFADCDGSFGNGCETHTSADVNNCGTCGHACGNPANGTAGCASGTCQVILCNSGFADCDGNFANGCETSTSANNSNCGTCGHTCNTSTSQCTNGSCLLKTGQACTLGNQCVSGVCTSSKCT